MIETQSTTFPRGIPATEVSHRHLALFQADDDAATIAHDELVDTVIHHLLEKDVDTIIDHGYRFPNPPDIHTGTFFEYVSNALSVRIFDSSYVVFAMTVHYNRILQ